MRSVIVVLATLALGCSSGSDSPNDAATPPLDTVPKDHAQDAAHTPDTAKTPGTEGGSCYGNGTCNEGLTCASELCVRLPDAAALDSARTDIASLPDATSDSGTGDAIDAALDAEAQDGATDAGMVDGAALDAMAPDIGVPVGTMVFRSPGEVAQTPFAGGTEEYVIAVYSVSTVASTGLSYTVEVNSGGAGGAGIPITPPPIPGPTPGAEEWSRNLAEQAAAKPIVKPGELPPPWLAAACSSSSQCGVDELCHEGNCTKSLALKVSSFSSAATIDANVKRKGLLTAVLVDSGDAVNDATLDAILGKLDTLIYPREVALFGNPPLTPSSATVSSDRNADGLLWVVLTSKVSQKNQTGFFLATDFVSDPNSNQADILYMDPTVTDLQKVYVTLAHELQHLLSFSAKVYRPLVNGGQGALEALWLDEGKSHFAEDACGFGGETVTMLKQETLTAFSATSLFEQVSDTLAMRGMAMTFVRYLFEQKGGVTYNLDGSLTDTGGAAWLQQLHTSTLTGTDLIDTTYGDHKAAFDAWIAAITLDGRSMSAPPSHAYGPLATDPATGQEIGVRIRGTKKDENGSPVTLNGPPETAITGTTAGTIPNATGAFYLLQGMTGSVSVTVSASEPSVRFAVVRIQ